MKSNLDRVLEELNKKTKYKIQLKLSESMFLLIEDDNSVHKNTMYLKNSESIHCIPFYESGKNFEEIADVVNESSKITAPDERTNEMTQDQIKLMQQHGNRFTLLETLFQSIENYSKDYLDAIDDEIDNVSNERFLSPDEKRKTTGIISRMADRIFLGSFSKQAQNQLDSYAERYIAWSVLGRGTNHFASRLSHDTIYLNDTKHFLSEDMPKMVAFYTEIYSKTYDIIPKLRELYKKASSYFNEHSILHRIDNIEQLKNRILSKLN